MLFISRKKILQVISLFFCCVPCLASAAVIYLDPPQAQISPGQSLICEIKIDAKNECVNAVEVRIQFDSKALKLLEFSRGESIMPIWVNAPRKDQIVISNQTGKIFFSGGIPGGYCGGVVKDNGENNILAKLVFKAAGLQAADSGQKETKIEFLENSKVYLNNGLGTLADLSRKPAVVLIDGKNNGLFAQWSDEVKKDKIPPEPFEIKIQRDPQFFDGKYFAVFLAADKQTGIDYYELSEQPAGGKIKDEKWARVESPYILGDQKLESVVRVRAFDLAGNLYEAAYKPESFSESSRLLKTAVVVLILIIICVLICFLLLFFYRKSTR